MSGTSRPRKKYKPVRLADVTDEKLIAGQLRALQRDVRADLELVRNKVLTTFNRLEHHFDDIIARVSDLERRVSALERARSA